MTDATLISDREVRKRLGVSVTTVWRWQRDASVGFPKAIYIRGRKFRDSAELDAWRMRMGENPEAMRKPNDSVNVAAARRANAERRKGGARRKQRKVA